MDRRFSSYTLKTGTNLKDRLLAWASTYSACCLLDSFAYELPYHSYDLLIGAGVSKRLTGGDDLISSISAFDASIDDWIFGHIGYDVFAPAIKKNGSGFATAFLFVPEVVVQLKADVLSIGVPGENADELYREILSSVPPAKTKYSGEIKSSTSREAFINTVKTLQQHIRRGDCYEINYCQEFYIESIEADPVDLYRQFTAISPSPFSSFYKVDDQYALCTSPERYIQKNKNKLLSQPIKGTAARNLNDPAIDKANRLALQESEKDKRENVIVVDLVRNDLSRVCEPGSVVVEELFGIYAFPTVYQMISTVAGKLQAGQDFARVLEATFPMGSMTGAPKKKVMELIDRYESVNRGLYSGTIGYIDPEKNYDFNVVIRTILYNKHTRYLNYLAGAGITDLSDPEQEYEECLLKASALKRLFST